MWLSEVSWSLHFIYFMHSKGLIRKRNQPPTTGEPLILHFVWFLPHFSTSFRTLCEFIRVFSMINHGQTKKHLKFTEMFWIDSKALKPNNQTKLFFFPKPSSPLIPWSCWRIPHSWWSLKVLGCWKDACNLCLRCGCCLTNQQATKRHGIRREVTAMNTGSLNYPFWMALAWIKIDAHVWVILRGFPF